MHKMLGQLCRHKCRLISSNTIKTDYRSLQPAIIHSSWTPTLRRCTNPVQLRITISRIFAISPNNQPPLHVDIIAALDACARIAMIGSSGYAPMLISNQLPDTSVNKVHYFQQQGFESAQTIMHTISKLNIMPSTSIYSAYIRVCAHACQVNAAFLAFNEMKRNGLTPDLDVFKGLIMAAAMHGDLNKALTTINLSVSHTRLIVKHATTLKLALRFVTGLEIGKFMGVFASIYAEISQTHAQFIGLGFGIVFGFRLCIPILINMHAGTTTTDNSPTPPSLLSAKYQKISSNPSSSFYSLDAKEVNEHMLYFLLGLLEQSHNVNGIIQVLKAMEVHGLKISSKTYSSLVSELVAANKPDLALQMIQKVYTKDDQPPVSVFTIILQHYYDQNEFQKAIDVYEQYMTSLQLNINAYTTLISAFGKVNNVDRAMYLYDQFLKDGFSPNRFVLNTLISILAMNGKYTLAEEVVLVTMTKYDVYPSLRSFCKLIEKARSITPDQYTPPPLSSQFTPPELPAKHKPNFPGKSNNEIPIQVQRAWYWYHRSLSSGLVNNYIPVTFLMLVLNVFGYGEPGVLEYAQSLRPSVIPPFLPVTRWIDSGIALLVPKQIPLEQGPLVLTYFTVMRSCTRSTTIPLAYALGVLYDAKARHAWEFPLPIPTSSLVPLVAFIQDQTHSDHAAQVDPRYQPTWSDICHRSNILLQEFVNRCLVDHNVDRDLQRLVSQITHMFLLNVCGTQPCLDSNPQASSETRTRTVASGHSPTLIFGPPQIIDDLDEDEVVAFNHSSVPFKPVRLPPVVRRTSHSKRQPGFALPASAKRGLAVGDFRALKSSLKQLDHKIGIGQSKSL